jgi:hypothetical protein
MVCLRYKQSCNLVVRLTMIMHPATPQVLKSPGTSTLDKALAEVTSTLAANTADLEAWAVKAVR